MKNKLVSIVISFLLIVEIVFLPILNFSTHISLHPMESNKINDNSLEILSDDDVIRKSFNINDDKKISQEININTTNINTTINLVYFFSNKNSFEIDISNTDESYSLGNMIETPTNYDNDAMFNTLLFNNEPPSESNSYKFTTMEENSFSVMFGVYELNSNNSVTSEDFTPIRIDFKFSNSIVKKHKNFFKLEKKDLFYKENKGGYKFFEKESKILKKKNNKDLFDPKKWSINNSQNIGVEFKTNINEHQTLSLFVNKELEPYKNNYSRNILTNSQELFYAEKGKIGNLLTFDSYSYSYPPTFWIRNWCFSLDITNGKLDINKINNFIDFLNEQFQTSKEYNPIILSETEPIKVLEKKEMFVVQFNKSAEIKEDIDFLKRIRKSVNEYFDDNNSNLLFKKMYINKITTYNKWNEYSSENEEIVSNNGLFLYGDQKNKDIFISNSQILFFVIFSLMVIISAVTILYFMKSNKSLNESIVIKNKDIIIDKKNEKEEKNG